jgi:curved DNA-binding protein CbpA
MNPEKPTTGSKLPNLYELLGLPAKVDDEQSIKSALREFAERVKQMKSPESAKDAARLFAIAKQNLLDPARKAAYDSLWDKVYGSNQTKAADSLRQTQNTTVRAETKTAATKTATTNPVAISPVAPATDSTTNEAKATRAVSPIETAAQASVQEPSWDLSELHSLLPFGDPHAPLDLAAFLESTDSQQSDRSAEDLDRDFQRLLQLLGGEIANDVPPENSATSMNDGRSKDLFEFAADVKNEQPAKRVNSSDLFAPNQTEPTAAGNFNPPPSERRQASSVGSRVKRKNRDRSLLVMIGVGLTVMLGVLGFLLFMLNKKLPTQDNTKTIAAVDNSKTNKPANTVNANNTKPIGSGLPQVGSGLPQPGEDLGSDPGADPLQNTEAMPMDKPENPSPAPAALPVPPTPPEMPANVPVSVPTTVPETESMVTLSQEEKNDWTKLLKSARQELSKREFEKAKSSLQKATELAKSPQQKKQLARLSTIAPLVEQFHQAVRAAVAGFGAAEVFKAGSQEISYVDSNDQKLVVKIKGGRKEFSWDELPIGIANGLADLKLDQSPKSAAVKAAFAAVHSRVTGAAKEEARKLMQTAAAANVVPADAHEIFDDEYSLD